MTIIQIILIYVTIIFYDKLFKNIKLIIKDLMLAITFIVASIIKLIRFLIKKIKNELQRNEIKRK